MGISEEQNKYLELVYQKYLRDGKVSAVFFQTIEPLFEKKEKKVEYVVKKAWFKKKVVVSFTEKLIPKISDQRLIVLANAHTVDMLLQQEIDKTCNMVGILAVMLTILVCIETMKIGILLRISLLFPIGSIVEALVRSLAHINVFEKIRKEDFCK